MAAQIHVWEDDIKPKDAIHVATAVTFGANALETFYGVLICKRGKVGIPPLMIREPHAAEQARMLLVAPIPEP